MADRDLINLRLRIADEIGDDGRIILRKSGTENLIRVMVEHKNPDKCKQYLDKIAELVREKNFIYERKD